MDCSDIIERQLLMNLNQNFVNLKHDFVEPLNLISHFLEMHPKSRILTKCGSPILLKLIRKTNNLDQNIQSIKILKLLVDQMDET